MNLSLFFFDPVLGVVDPVVARFFFVELPGVTETTHADLCCGVEAEEGLPMNTLGRAGFR